jgi:diguanylate cyclase (GGDEF)-like protein
MPPRLAGRTAGLLFVGSSAMTLLYVLLPEAIVTDRVALYRILGAATLIGLVAYVVPWDRWHPRATLVLLAPAFALLAAGNYLGTVQAFAFPIFFVVTFVWIGAAHPRWTSLLCVAPATVAYVVPIALRPQPLAIDITSVVITMPACVLVAETLAAVGDRERRSRNLAQSLAATSEALAASLDKDVVLDVLIEEARRATRSQHGVLFEGDPDTLTITGVHTAGIDARLSELYRDLTGLSFADFPAVQRIADGSEPVVVLDTSSPHGYPSELIDPFGVKSFLAFAIRVDGRGVGILTCGQSSAPRRYTQDELALVAALAAQAGQTIKNALLYRHSVESAHQDPLTGLGNRRAFDARVEKEIAGSRKDDGRFDLIVVDIDGFKKLNDTYGHHEGDLALRGLATLLGDACRSSDGAYRIGGDEFAIVLTHAEPGTGMSAAKRLLCDIDRASIGQGSNLSLTVSIGVSSFPEDGSTFKQIFEGADKALYSVKRCGGNGSAAVARDD